MKEIIREKVQQAASAEGKYNLLRENLQALVLKTVEESEHAKNLAFVGGTALRFLYDLGRFSEDLDFSLVSAGGFDLQGLLNTLQKNFESWGMKLESKPKKVKNVESSFLKIPEIMHENGLTHRKDQKLFIKLDVDTKPPAGSVTALSFNQKYLPMNILHYDLPSLFAGKLHAVLLRQYTKGRDFYDLMWFLGKKITPNFVQLENAIEQTTGKRANLNVDILKEKLIKRISEADFEKIISELNIFLTDKNELKYITAPNLGQLVDKM